VSTSLTARPVDQVDVRGPRFAAWITTVVLAIVLLTGSWGLLAIQAVVFVSAPHWARAAAPTGCSTRGWSLPG